MPNFNDAINPKTVENPYNVELARCRASEIKQAKKTQGKASAGASDGNTGTVYIPDGDNAFDRTIRLHEAMHASHTPASSKFKDMLDQSLEDARLHRYCSKTSTSQFQLARRDELAVALRDLRKTKKHPKLKPISALASMRALGILSSSKIKPLHKRLLQQVFSRFGENALQEFTRSLDALKTSNGDNTREDWQKARKHVKTYFREDFESDKPAMKLPETKGDAESSDSKGEPSMDSRLPGVADEPEDKPNEDKPKKAKTEKPTDTPNEPEDEDEDDEDSDSDTDTSESTDEDTTDGQGKGESSDSDSESEDSDSSSETEMDSEDEPEDSDSSSETEMDSEDEPEDSDSDSDSESSTGKMAPIPETPKLPKAKPVMEDEYKGDLTPECDKAKFGEMSKDFPLRIYIRRLDMGINRVKLSLGRNAPVPATTGRRILARKLACAVTTPGTRVFARSVAQGGFGTILIDASGSMSIPSETLQQFLSNAPALTLAFYNAPNDSTDHGNIFIYAANGYRSDAKHIHKTDDVWDAETRRVIRQEGVEHYGHGNVIDYHAMAWLIKQPAPHYIITDCQFTGPWAYVAIDLRDKLIASKQLIVVPTLDAMQAELEKTKQKR